MKGGNSLFSGYLGFGTFRLKGIAVSMEEDYLPLYEIVDHNENENHSSVNKSSGYQKLMATEDHTNSMQEEYQLPQSYTGYIDYSEVSNESQSLKRSLRCLKIFFSIGGITIFVLLILVVCTFTATWMRFGRNLAQVQKKLHEQLHNEQKGSTTEHTDHDQRMLDYHGSFRNCSQENTSCNFRSNSSDLDSWLYCDTPNLQMHKEVT